MPRRRNRLDFDQLNLERRRPKLRSAFVVPDVHGVIKFDLCDLDTITENSYIPWVALFDYGTSGAPEVIS